MTVMPSTFPALHFSCRFFHFFYPPSRHALFLRLLGSENEKHKAFHVVSAFVAKNQLTLGEVTVPEKTNEITAIPELLDLIDVEDGIVTLDAMGCQKKIVEKICQRKADYVIALKGNQGDFHSDVELFFSEFASKYPKYTPRKKVMAGLRPENTYSAII